MNKINEEKRLYIILYINIVCHNRMYSIGSGTTTATNITICVPYVVFILFIKEYKSLTTYGTALRSCCCCRYVYLVLRMAAGVVFFIFFFLYFTHTKSLFYFFRSYSVAAALGSLSLRSSSLPVMRLYMSSTSRTVVSK